MASISPLARRRPVPQRRHDPSGRNPRCQARVATLTQGLAGNRFTPDAPTSAEPRRAFRVSALCVVAGSAIDRHGAREVVIIKRERYGIVASFAGLLGVTMDHSAAS
ncbi:MAG TPA: hypothetical protein VIF88_02060 [Methylocystis sp.]